MSGPLLRKRRNGDYTLGPRLHAIRRMPMPPVLFDLSRLRLRRARAARAPAGIEDFLDRRAASDIAERLAAEPACARAAALFGTNATFAATIAAALPSARTEEFGLDRFLSEGAASLDAWLKPASFDRVAAGLGLHWMNDLPGVLALMRRSLRPGGMMIAALPGEGTLAELRDALLRAESAVSGGASLRVGPFADIKALGGLLQRAGFAMPVADQNRLVLRHRDVAALIRDLRAMAMTNVVAGPVRPVSRAALAQARHICESEFRDADGRIRASFPIVYLTGRAPAATG
jgi:SAM-dependent methyltransferase